MSGITTGQRGLNDADAFRQQRYSYKVEIMTLEKIVGVCYEHGQNHVTVTEILALLLSAASLLSFLFFHDFKT